jgi:hypothetical protein
VGSRRLTASAMARPYDFQLGIIRINKLLQLMFRNNMDGKIHVLFQVIYLLFPIPH